MDPTKCLEEMREVAKEVADGLLMADPGRLAELVQALDGWIMKGRFLPKQWERNPHVIPA